MPAYKSRTRGEFLTKLGHPKVTEGACHDEASRFRTLPRRRRRRSSSGRWARMHRKGTVIGTVTDWTGGVLPVSRNYGQPTPSTNVGYAQRTLQLGFRFAF